MIGTGVLAVTDARKLVEISAINTPARSVPLRSFHCSLTSSAAETLVFGRLEARMRKERPAPSCHVSTQRKGDALLAVKEGGLRWPASSQVKVQQGGDGVPPPGSRACRYPTTSKLYKCNSLLPSLDLFAMITVQLASSIMG